MRKPNRKRQSVQRRRDAKVRRALARQRQGRIDLAVQLSSFLRAPPRTAKNPSNLGLLAGVARAFHGVFGPLDPAGLVSP